MRDQSHPPDTPDRSHISRHARSDTRAAVRDKAIDAARVELREQGVEAVSMRAVARRADVPVTSLYRHFADRADLLDALAACSYEELTAALAHAVDAVPRTEPEQRFRVLAHALRSWSRPHFAEFALLYAPGPHAEEPWSATVLAARGRATVLVGSVIAGVMDRHVPAHGPALAAGAAIDPRVQSTTMSAWAALIGHIALAPRRGDLMRGAESHYAHHVELVLQLVVHAATDETAEDYATSSAQTTTLPR